MCRRGHERGQGQLGWLLPVASGRGLDGVKLGWLAIHYRRCCGLVILRYRKTVFVSVQSQPFTVLLIS